MNDKELTAIRARYEASTPGTWEPHYSYWAVDGTIAGRGVQSNYAKVIYNAPYNRQEDVDFIAHAHQDIPALLAEIEHLRERMGNDDLESR